MAGELLEKISMAPQHSTDLEGAWKGFFKRGYFRFGFKNQRARISVFWICMYLLKWKWEANGATARTAPAAFVATETASSNDWNNELNFKLEVNNKKG